MAEPKPAERSEPGAALPVPPAPGASTSPPSAPADEGRGVMPIEEFTALASKLVSFSMHKEAIGLYETAVKLYPENLALKINLARVRDMKRRSDERLLKELDQNIQEKREREDLLALHASGLALQHYRRGELDRARDLFEFARQCNPNAQTAGLFLARLHVARNDLERALAVLEEARRANPFHEEVQSLLGRVYMERGDHARAANALVDAFLLSGEPEVARQPFYHRHLLELLRRLGWSDADLGALVAERQAKFNQLLERLERVRRERAAAASSARLGSILVQLSHSAREASAASTLRRFLIFERTAEEDLAVVHRLLKREELADGQAAFGERDSTGRLYLVDRGTVRVRRATPFGDVVLARYVPGQVFGEMDFLDGHGHSADAVAEGETVLLTLAREDAQRLFETRKAFAVQCLSYFWRSLAENIRTTNEQMKTFFVKESMAAEPRLDERQRASAERVIIDINRKIALFKEKGLSPSEIKILATLSTEERYARDDLIFAEGDAGGKLYIVLEGRVRIGKTIPGVGEEALAILERGDFFGEMALIDDKPRSADARAHEGDTTVLAIDKRVLEDVLSQDLKSAELFLSILCRILCQRLREINETIVKWKIMSGGF